jgi:hypothetical protein
MELECDIQQAAEWRNTTTSIFTGYSNQEIWQTKGSTFVKVITDVFTDTLKDLREPDANNPVSFAVPQKDGTQVSVQIPNWLAKKLTRCSAGEGVMLPGARTC